MSDETKHTPLPWELAAESGVGMISSGNNAIVDFDWYDDNKLENAILIVRAVNAHKDLTEERDALREALKKIANADGCGCSPICECLSKPCLEIWKEEAMETAKAVLSKYP